MKYSTKSSEIYSLSVSVQHSLNTVGFAAKNKNVTGLLYQSYSNQKYRNTPQNQ